MGAEYRDGEYYGSSTTINDNVISEKSTWSSEKIAGQIDDRNISEGKTWSSDKIDSTKADNSVIAPVESESTASQSYAIGEHFIRDSAFCTAKTAIAQGEAFTLNTNYTAGDVAKKIFDVEKAEYEWITMGNFSGIIFRYGKLRIISIYNGTSVETHAVSKQLEAIDIPLVSFSVGSWCLIADGIYGSRYLNINQNGLLYTNGEVARGGFTMVYVVA